MHIIQANENHLAALVPLFDAYRIWYRKSSDKENAHHFLRERIVKHESVIYLVQDHSSRKYIGFTQLYPLFSSTRLGRLWLLNDLYVIPEYRGQGVSLQLINRAKELARTTNAVGIMLETEKSNKIGNRLYPKTDFELEEDMNNYFWSNDC